MEPLFLQSEQNKLPSLKRVIVFHNGELAWAETLGEALAKLFAAGEDTRTGLIDDGAPGDGEDDAGVEEKGDEDMAPELESLDELINRANQLFRQAKERQKNGDWAGYGEALSELESVLERMANQ